MMADDLEWLRRLEPNLRRRARVLELIRAFFAEQGFIEVETPLRVPAVAPEPYIAPFESDGWFLSTSPELHMKRLLAAGYDRLFQISRCFRKGERGRWHNQEFTMLEWYRTSAGFQQMIADTEQLTLSLAGGLGLGTTIKYQGQDIDLSPPWPRITVRDAFIKAAGWDPTVRDDSCRFDTDLVTRVLPAFPAHRPIVLTDYPGAMASLARIGPGSGTAERAEAFIGGLELANAYSELTDPREQERRFAEATEQIRSEQGRLMPRPHRFLEAMPDLPECAGAALGIDRLVMLLCDAASIDDVIAFTSDTA